VVTSPPYFGLRDYGTGEWEGGDPACDHSPEQRGGRFATPVSAKQASNTGSGTASARDCPCGARRVDRQIGLEPTPDEFVAALVEVFREVRRVLRDDGTVWLNLGDSYASSSTYNTANSLHTDHGWKQDTARRPNAYMVPGCKPKDLIGIPWMVAFALRADGWYLRSDIIWSKPNPMPESVTDRPTKSHEYVFLLSKSGKALLWTHRDGHATNVRPMPDYVWMNPETQEESREPMPSPWRRSNLWRGADYFYDADAIREPDAGQDHAHRNVLDGQPSLEPSNGLRSTHGGLRTMEGRNGAGRNKRSVWTVATQPYAGAHFATFPPKLIEPCILAGAPRQACSVCGAPWVRVVERTPMVVRPGPKREAWQAEDDHARTQTGGTMLEPPTSRTVGFESSCSHGDGNARGVVLDLFAGAGTSGLVALQHGRDFIGIELNPEYADMARLRIETAIRLGFRAPQNGHDVPDGQLDLFGA
jgi:DNA modification methylase